jgi:phospholipase/carboxylesterase
MQPLDGPRLEPRTAPKGLVVLLHGYGASGDDLFALAEAWQPALPPCVFVAPHAPERLPHAYGASGFQWFPLTLRDPAEYLRGTRAAAPLLDGFLDAELSRHGLGANRLCLVGFSQGTMMALHVGLRRTVPPAVIVGYSGLLAGPERLVAEATCRPPVVLVHGMADDVIPAEALHISREALAGAGCPVEWHGIDGLGHGIDGLGLRIGGEWLRRSLG